MKSWAFIIMPTRQIKRIVNGLLNETAMRLKKHYIMYTSRKDLILDAYNGKEYTMNWFEVKRFVELYEHYLKSLKL